MSYDLSNPSTNISRKYSTQFWAKALELLRLYGWKPMGTCPPSREVDWLGVYLTNDGQACPWENAKDDKIESTDKMIDRLVYELSPEWDDIWVER